MGALVLAAAPSPGSQTTRALAYASSAPKAAGEQSDAQALQLVENMLRAQRTLSFSGEQVTTIYGPGGPINSSEQTVTHDGIRGMRMDYHSPARLAGEIRGDNGRFLWRYAVDKRTVEQLPSALERMRNEIRIAENAIRNRRVLLRLIGQDSVAGRRAFVVQASPAGAAPASTAGARRFWIDPASGAQLRIVIFGPSGNPISDSYFTQITYNPPLPSDIFDPPADAARIAPPAEEPSASVKHVPAGVVPALGFDILEPAYLPPGYHFDKGQIFQYKGQPAFGIRYDNGLTVVSLYELAAKKPAPRNHFRLNRAGMLTGVQSGIQIVLLGNLDPSDLIRIYQSLH